VTTVQSFLAGALGLFLFLVLVFLTAKLWRFGTLRGEEAFREHQERKRRQYHDEEKTPQQQGD
jgi:flagellar biosynthesis/type III secretory pathway M-ring protein FliF/YscJ